MTEEESYEVIDRLLMAAFGDKRVIDKFCAIIAKQIKDRVIQMLIDEGLNEFKLKEGDA
ncbi:hypothetical protein IJH24_03540 [Candidatus Saccharibacteria bacterium]|nr:hypothetical protein [Candidatus Saccharibacteria bacterium]